MKYIPGEAPTLARNFGKTKGAICRKCAIEVNELRAEMGLDVVPVPEYGEVFVS
jgi:hypothetical protein